VLVVSVSHTFDPCPTAVLYRTRACFIFRLHTYVSSYGATCNKIFSVFFVVVCSLCSDGKSNRLIVSPVLRPN